MRTAALIQLADRAAKGDQTAIAVIVDAIGRRLVTDWTPPQRGDAESAPDAGVPKGEGGPQRVRITPDGEIVEGEDAAVNSTLHEILTPEIAPDSMDIAEDTPEEGPAKRRKRRPVEGPDDIPESLCADTIHLCGRVSNPAIEAAVLERTSDRNEHVRRAAWLALAQWPASDRHSAGTCDAARVAMGDRDPAIRHASFDILSRTTLPPDCLARAIEDSDALLRAKAVALMPAEIALDFLSDDASVVRKAAVAGISDRSGPALVSAAADRLIDADRIDTLGILFSTNAGARRYGLRRLSQDPAPRKALVILEALASTEQTGTRL